jgi:ADP-ribose pyrophosphatase YjhB (NUDIX family)
MKAGFCAECGGAILTRQVEGRQREVCGSCGRVFYRNPLPVAAAVVLDAERQVLLIKRRKEPRRGLWCLPMGFAELDETIGHAALRELEEEAGIQGRIVRLLAVESAKIAPYGDLLVITFEIEKTGGIEQAGDDAEAIMYCPLDRLPKLAFAANALAALISRHAHEIAQGWLDEVRSHPTTPTYGRTDPAILLPRAVSALSQFSTWLSGLEDNQEIAGFYQRLGAERRDLGFELQEVISSLTLLRKHMLQQAMKLGVWKGALDAYRVLELDYRIMLFFDKAIYHTARGFASGRC